MIVHLQTWYDTNEEKVTIAMAFVELGGCYLGKSKLISAADDQAFLNFQRAMEICDISDVYVYLGMLHSSKETKYYDPKKAIGYYEQYLTRIGPPQYDDAERKSKRKMVEEWLISSEDTEILVWMARSYIGLEMYDDAYEYLVKSISLKLVDPTLHKMLTEVYLGKGLKEDAIKSATKALSLNPPPEITEEARQILNILQ